MTKIKKIFFLVISMLIISTISSAQEPPENATETSEKELERQLSRNYVDLYQIKEFPFKKIYITNKNIERLSTKPSVLQSIL